MRRPRILLEQRSRCLRVAKIAANKFKHISKSVANERTMLNMQVQFSSMMAVRQSHGLMKNGLPIDRVALNRLRTTSPCVITMMSMILGDRVGACDLIEIGFDNILELLGVRNLTMFRRQLLPHLPEEPAFPHVAILQSRRHTYGMGHCGRFTSRQYDSPGQPGSVEMTESPNLL